MNVELFIARRLFSDKKKSLARQIIGIALAGIALGLAVMIIAVAVVTGFKKEVQDKICGFGSHFQIINFDVNNSFETQAINVDQKCIPEIKKIHAVFSVDAFATKPGLIKTDENIQGIVLKGVNTTGSLDFYRKNLLEGSVPAINDSVRVNDIILSEQIAKLLKLKINDPLYMYFINEQETNPRMVQFRISGIYRTNLEEFDKTFIIGDIKYVQRLNNWNKNEVSGFDVRLTDFKLIDETEGKIRECVTMYNEANNTLRVQSIKNKYPQIFDWLSVLDMNVWIILTLMILVAGFNMISGLLVIILEKSAMIGILKSMGSNNWNIRKIFLYLTGFLTTRGMLWGNILGLAIILAQKYFRLIHLDPTSYYVEVVPVNLSLTYLFALNIGTLIITIAMLVLPSQLISRISPDKSMRFD
jgi:lipoprotein-releasing system permease protein